MEVPRGSPARLSQREPLLATLRVGIAAARDLKVRLAYLSAAVSRASLSIISAFLFLWMVQAGKDQGVTPAEAYAGSGGIFIAIQITATVWAIVVISFIDRIDRVLTMAVGSALACASYTLFGLVDDPFQPVRYAAAVFLGIFFATIVGGYLFDFWRPSAPYVVMGAVSGVLCLAATYTWSQTRTAVATIAARAARADPTA